MMNVRQSFFVLVAIICCNVSISEDTDDDMIAYGVDLSFPIQHSKVSDNYAWLPHNLDLSLPIPARYDGMEIQHFRGRQEFYDNFMQSCRDAFGKKGKRCDSTERDRIAMALRQPQSMQNYTELGFKKIRAPEKVYSLIQDFWNKNKHKASKETWGAANTYTNNWEVPTEMVSVEDKSLRGGGYALKQRIWDAARDTLAEWTGQELTQCSLYGIRVYHENSVLATHVDRMPLVSSAIINVAQDVDEPWPIEVYGHDGKAYNVTMEPGDMVLYESHSVLHGRPFPLKGRMYANIFVHFEPTGHSLRHYADIENNVDVHAKYKLDIANGISGHENNNNGLPPYVIPGSAEEANWRMFHPEGNKNKNDNSSTQSYPVHRAAQIGSLARVMEHVEKSEKAVNELDGNGWTPLHEAARAGHTEIVKYLVAKGANLSTRTGGGIGQSPLWWAKHENGANHPVVAFLKEMGAEEIDAEEL